MRVWCTFQEQEALDDADPFRFRMSLIRAYAERWAPCFGHVSYFQSLSKTALELGLSLHPSDDIEEIRAWARGYSWVTVLSDDLVERLGGIRPLQESHAFTKVEPLANGSVWLQATDTWAEYDMDAVHRVFEAVRPVILRGAPKPSQLRRFRPDIPPELVVFSSPTVTPDR